MFFRNEAQKLCSKELHEFHFPELSLMNFLKVFIISLMLAISVAPLLGQTTIVSPTNGQQLSSPFTLNMWADSCDGNQVGSVGYSLDDSGNTSAWNTWYIHGPVVAPSGWHTLHVKAWDVYGDACATDISIDITSGSVVPNNAIAVGDLQTYGNWIAVNDDSIGGWSSGTSYLAGTARLFANEFNYDGGERYSLSFAGDTPEQNYFYDAWVYIADDTRGFVNLEFDLNHAMDSGVTAIMGIQCDGWTNTWDYTINGGSPTSPSDIWLHSFAPCNVNNWGVNQWHHVQIFFSHDGDGWVTYHSISLDGNEQDLNYGVFSGFRLGWSPSIVTNFQIDGSSSGTTWSNVYLGPVTVYRW
jgi:hypothetical protein